MNTLFKIVLISFLLLSINSYARVFDVADVVKPGKIDLGLESEFIINKGFGFHAIGSANFGMSDVVDYGVFIGTGNLPFQLGFFSKYLLFPDIRGQFGLAFVGGLKFIRDSGKNVLSIMLHPIISKSFIDNKLTITPYGSIQSEIWLWRSSLDLPVRFVGGTKFAHKEIENWSFLGELGVGLTKIAYSYIRVGAKYLIDNDF